MLTALQVVRPAAPAPPDPLVLAVWFHHVALSHLARQSGHPALSAASAYDRLAAVAEPAVAAEVARLVRQLGLQHPDPDDAASLLLHTAHSAALSAG